MTPREDNATLATVTAPLPASEATRSGDSGSAQIDVGSVAFDTHPIAPSQLRDRSRYVMLGEHGRGGLGRVARAHDLELRRDVAIKELLSLDDNREARFVREAMITARLEHPGIVPIHEAGRWGDGTPFYAMKLVSGRPLRDLIAERTTVERRIGLLHHVVAVADAIAYAHGRNIIHRDLKPANIIVGDFGETIVIDWGLAKDLSTAEGSTFADGRGITDHNNDLTADGSVLGTPTYMAPEQQRGEQVDQRADVFAIGAMLWELCALPRVPPVDTKLRHKLLRRAGIDRDLVTILDKALEPDASRRYPDAGALAADLKAFKAGARIAARRYSPFEKLSHWARRHRSFSLSISMVLVLGLVGGSLYVRNIATERDRADAALLRVQSAKNELVLEHAELLLQSDPTAAAETLQSYRGDQVMRHAQLLAEAHGRGVAGPMLHPHNDTVWLLASQPDGSFVSVGEDHRILQTSSGQTTTLATNVSATVISAYAANLRLVAYSTTPTGVALLNLVSKQVIKLDKMPPIALTFSPDGSRLAALDKLGTLVTWNVYPDVVELYRDTVPTATAVTMLDNSTVILIESRGIRSISITDKISTMLDVHAASVSAIEQYTAIGHIDGDLSVASRSLRTLATIHACKTLVEAVEVIAERKLIVFGCHEGGGGVASYSTDRHELRVVDKFSTGPEPILIGTYNEATNLIVTSYNTVYNYNIDTKIMTRMEGQGAIVSAIGLPTPANPHILVGDVDGAVRTWDLPQTSARVVSHFPGVPFGVRFSDDGRYLAIYGSEPMIDLLRISDGTLTALRGHTSMVGGVHFSPDGGLLMSYSWDGTARVWRTSDGSLVRTFSDHRAVIEDGDFIGDGQWIATVGDDGKLYRWKAEREETELLLSRNFALTAMEVLPGTQTIVVQGFGGGLWVVSPGGPEIQLRAPDGVEIMCLRASQSGTFVATGQEDGMVAVYRTKDWASSYSVRVKGSVERVEFDTLDRDILVSSQAGFVHLFPLDARRKVRWQSLKVRAKDVTYSPRGNAIAISAFNGGLWFYSFEHASWSYQYDHHSQVRSGRFSPDDASFMSADHDGVVIERDLKMIHHPLSN